MANPWFRMYAEFATDPKVQMMSEADQRRFVMLLACQAAQAETIARLERELAEERAALAETERKIAALVS